MQPFSELGDLWRSAGLPGRKPLAGAHPADFSFDAVELRNPAQSLSGDLRAVAVEDRLQLPAGMMVWIPPFAKLNRWRKLGGMRNKQEVLMSHVIALVGLDIAKAVFQVHAAAEDGTALLRKKLKRAEVEPFFRKLLPCRIGLEACPGGHHWARLLRSMGHDVRLLPAQYVRPYVKTNKNDAADAEAICEAMTRPSMRFVPIKEEHQQEILVLHRVREMLMRQRTQLINGIRGHLTEFGIIAPARAHRIGLLIDVIRDEDDTRLPPAGY